MQQQEHKQQQEGKQQQDRQQSRNGSKSRNACKSSEAVDTMQGGQHNLDAIKSGMTASTVEEPETFQQGLQQQQQELTTNTVGRTAARQ
jgi:hypothetical protein